MLTKALRTVIALFAGGIIAAPPSSAALVISVGEEWVFNFDFRREAPPPPYTCMKTTYQFRALAAGAQLTQRVFNDLDGQGNFRGGGSYHGPGPNAFGICASPNNLSDGQLDGVFSSTVTVDFGSFELIRFESISEVSGLSVLIDGEPRLLVSEPVSEPASLALVAFGFLGVVGTRELTRRRLSVGA
jgi:hypothetical protein